MADKAVRGATKPKHAAPKAKYVDPIVSSTFAQDGSFHEICRALAVKLKDPNSTVVFKSLIVIHTLARAGNQETVLGYLSGTKILGLEQVVSGYDIAQNLSKYASYLDRRIRTYGALKYDIIRDKGERRGEREGMKGCNRLRHLTVDKGLLRETTLLQKEMDALAECKFYLDDMNDDLTMTALRMLVKDLLMLFQAVNEGVINVLEHYFEMSHPDASTALKIYKRFCSQTENVVAYLGVAKKLQNVINVPIPNLKHAPVSLAGSLEEYLKDPNFEQNREEYKENKRIVDGKPPTKPVVDKPAPSKIDTSAETKKETTVPPKSFTDFFEAIETGQETMFNPQTGSPTMAYFQQQAAYNPFLAPQMTGFPAQNGMQMQATGFMNTGFVGPSLQMQGQPTGYSNPFNNAAALQPQMTGFAAGGLMPQQTGYNPFRQSIATSQPMSMQPTGMMPSFSSAPDLSSMSTGISNPFLQNQNTTSSFPQAQSQPPYQQQVQQQPQQINAFGQFQQQNTPTASAFNRPASAFVDSSSKMPSGSSTLMSSKPTTLPPTSQPAAQPLTVQPTGSRNPFAPPPGTVLPAAPKPAEPSMNSIAAGAFQRAQSPFNNGVADQSTYSTSSVSGNQPSAQSLISQQTGGGGLMASLASSFVAPSSSGAAMNNGTSSLSSLDTSSFGGLSFSSPASASSAPAPLSAQQTGFGGSMVKPFQPSSSFGASLAESLKTQPTGLSNASNLTGSTSATNTTSSSAVFNPFRSSLASNLTGSTGMTSLSSQPTGFASGSISGPSGANDFTSQFSNNFGSQFKPFAQTSNATGYSQTQESLI